MCMFNTPDIPDPAPVIERSSSRLPDGQTATGAAGRRTQDRIRAGSNTILTSGSGVTDTAPTAGKTLLGQ